MSERAQVTRANTTTGLTIQNYNSELAVVSGGRLLSVQWKPYNVTAASEWKVEMNMNDVYGGAPGPGRCVQQQAWFAM